MSKTFWILFLFFVVFLIMDVVSIWAHGIESLAIEEWIRIIGKDLLILVLLWIIKD